MLSIVSYGSLHSHKQSLRLWTNYDEARIVNSLCTWTDVGLAVMSFEDTYSVQVTVQQAWFRLVVLKLEGSEAPGGLVTLPDLGRHSLFPIQEVSATAPGMSFKWVPRAYIAPAWARDYILDIPKGTILGTISGY